MVSFHCVQNRTYRKEKKSNVISQTKTNFFTHFCLKILTTKCIYIKKKGWARDKFELSFGNKTQLVPGNRLLNRIFKAGSIVKREALRFRNLTVGDKVDVRTKFKEFEWVEGKIINKNKETKGQVEVEFKKFKMPYRKWIHLDDYNECAEFQTESKNTQLGCGGKF